MPSALPTVKTVGPPRSGPSPCPPESHGRAPLTGGERARHDHGLRPGQEFAPSCRHPSDRARAADDRGSPPGGRRSRAGGRGPCPAARPLRSVVPGWASPRGATGPPVQTRVERVPGRMFLTHVPANSPWPSQRIRTDECEAPERTPTEGPTRVAGLRRWAALYGGIGLWEGLWRARSLWRVNCCPCTSSARRRRQPNRSGSSRRSHGGRGRRNRSGSGRSAPRRRRPERGGRLRRGRGLRRIRRPPVRPGRRAADPAGHTSRVTSAQERTVSAVRPFAHHSQVRSITWSSPRRETGSRCESGTVPPL